MTKEYYLKNKKAINSKRRGKYAANKESGAEYQRLLRRKIKSDVFSHYGGKCACCGESSSAFLAIDHVEGNGGEERRLLKQVGYGTRLYYLLKKRDYPAGYQILCFNCNWSKSHGGCPHKKAVIEFYGPSSHIGRNTCRT